jgi:hypothetical protein
MRLRLALREPAGRARWPVKRWALRRARAVADEWLLWGAVPRDSSPLLAKRAAELTSERNRRVLAGRCRRFIAELGDPRCRAYAINRGVMREHYRSLVDLAERLEDVSRPIPPAGVVLTERLLSDGAGPFYDAARADELGPALAAALEALDPRTSTGIAS